MTRTIRAIYKEGVFKPATPVPIAEGTEVQLVVTSDEKVGSTKDLIAALNEVAGLPREGPHDAFSGADHDSILYPKKP